MAQGNRQSAAGGGSEQSLFYKEGSQSANMKYPLLIGLSRRCGQLLE